MGTKSGLDRRFAVKQAHDHLARLVESRVIAPGDSLPSAGALSEEIGVSRPVVLDALKLLEAEGRITVTRGPAGLRLADPNGSSAKARLTWIKRNADTILQMAVLREFIEPGCIRRVAEIGMTAAVWRAADQKNKQLRRTDVSYRPGLFRLDTEFHELLYQATRMPLLQEAAENCRVWVTPTFDFLDWPPDRREASANEHQRILEAIKERDPVEAAEAALDHVRVSSVLVEAKIKELSKG